MTILFPQASAGHESVIGGKARGLLRAARAIEGTGASVPAWFVLSADVFAENPDESDRDVESLGDSREALAWALSSLCPDGARVAVRSSALDEDGTRHSFAGQFETRLDVASNPAEVEAAIRAVRRSGLSARLQAYRREQGLPPTPQPPAVIVQRMVRARVAGVAFSADPVDGRRGVAVISAVRGVGESLVSGQADADTWRVARDGAIIERHLAPALAAASAQDQQRSASPALPTLTDAEVRAVARLARQLAADAGRPQDIEWAYDDDRLLLLQTRPITSITSLPDPDGLLTIWDNSNIVESYSGVTTPMTFSFTSEIYAHVYQQFCRVMQVPERTIAAHEDVFRNMLGLVRGRLYYNLLNWYRVLALLPGYRMNRPFMEQMMGVREPLPEALAQEIGEASTGARVVDGVRFGVTVAGLIVNHLTLNFRVRGFTRRLDDALKPPVPPLAERRPDELVAHYRDLRSRLLLKWDAPLVNDFFAMIFYGLLRSLTQKWCGDTHGSMQNDLIGGEGGLVSAEPAVRMQRLARLAAQDANAKLRAALLTGSLEDVQQTMRDVPAFRAEYQAYLDKFGERTVNELKLESATLHDDPLPLLRTIGQMAERLATAPAAPVTTAKTSTATQTPGEASREAARRRVREALAGSLPRRLAFAWVLRHAQRRVRDRENLRLERTRLFGRVRRIMRELGRRFTELDMLDDPSDVFYLEIDEVLGLVEGRSTCANARALVAVRRSEFAEYTYGPVPDDRFETRGIVYRGHTFKQSPAASAASAAASASAASGAAATDTAAAVPGRAAADEILRREGVRKGIGCCAGIVRGPVRIVTDPRTVSFTEPAILVAENTDPGWILVFPLARGLLVERGSLLSHAAIVARELGIPAVVSLPGLTRWLRDGDWVEIDGSSGVVRRIEPEAGEPHA